MNAMFTCLLIYVIAGFFLFFFQRFVWKVNGDKRNRQLARRGSYFIWAGLFSNFLVTAFMGWNLTPDSSLEWFLEVVTAAAMMYGILLLQHGCSKGTGYRVAKPRT